MNGFRNNWSRGTNLFWFWTAALLAAFQLTDIFYIYAFKHEVSAFWLTWSFWDRTIKALFFAIMAWSYLGAARNAEDREFAPDKP